jgi:hypothetical protein
VPEISAAPYLETRSFDSDVPIEVNAAAVWLDEVTVENL